MALNIMYDNIAGILNIIDILVHRLYINMLSNGLMSGSSISLPILKENSLISQGKISYKVYVCGSFMYKIAKFNEVLEVQ